MILAINTSTRQFSVGLILEEGILLTEYIMSSIKSGSSYLMPGIDFLLRHSEKKLEDIKAVAVAIGPGSFTGLKVGLSVAKGMCFSMNIPIIGISSLEALAMQIPYSDIPITAIIDSRKREYFFAQFAYKKGELVRINRDECIKIEKFPERFREKTIFIGNDYISQAELIREYIGRNAILAPSYLWHIRSACIGILALRRLKEKRFDDLIGLDPIYLRPPEIRPNPYGLRS